MGYEITFNYHEEISKGEYNREELKKKTVKLGTEFEDVSLESVAGKIISQLARRNVLVVDVEIYEFVKKKISYKETPDGILIKNKKFSFDEGAVVSSPAVSVNEDNPSEQNTQQLLAQLLANPALLAALSNNSETPLVGLPASVKPPKGELKHIPSKQKPIRYELFNPIDKIFLEDARKRGIAFTLGKKYPIYSEKAAANQMIGMLYMTEDDKGQRTMLSDKFFTPDINKLEQGFVEEFKPAATKRNQGDGLDWSSFSDEDAPDIRG